MNRAPSSPRRITYGPSMTESTALQSIHKQPSLQEWEDVYLNRRRFPKRLLEEDAPSEPDSTHLDDSKSHRSVHSKSPTTIQSDSDAKADAQPPLPAPPLSMHSSFKGISSIPIGRYSILLLPCSQSTMPFSDFEDILVRSSRTMFYTVADCDPNGTFAPASKFEMVVPFAKTSKPGIQDTASPSPPRLPSSPDSSNTVIVPADSISQLGSNSRSHLPLGPTETRAQSVPPTSFPSSSVTPSPSRRTRFTTPLSVSTRGGGTSLEPLEERRAFRSTSGGTDEGGFTVWYHTEAPYALTSPRPLSNSPTAGTVYVHTNISDSARQVWVWLENGAWCLVEAGDTIAHPVYDHRYLWVHSNGVPSWVLRNTLKNYSKQQGSSSGSISVI